MRRFAVVLSAMAALALVWTGTALAQAEHCPGEPGGNEFKAEGQGSTTFVIDGQEVNVNVSGDTVTFTDENGDPISVSFCIKAGEGSSGVLTGSSGSVTWDNGGGQTPAISYVVVFDVGGGGGGGTTTGGTTTGGTTTGGTTTGGGGAGAGGGGGGESLGEAAGGAGAGALPFTGLPVWIVALAGLALIGGGFALLRWVRPDH
jgi:hypothetical protein